MAHSTLQGIQDLLSFPIKGQQERNRLLVAGAVNIASFFIPFLPGIFLMGYGGLIMRSVIKDRAEPAMPEWKDFGGMFSLGLKLFGASFIYSLPAFIIVLAGYAVMVVPSFMLAFSRPHTNADVTRMMGTSLLGTFGGMFLMGIGFLFLIPFFLCLPAVLSHVATTDSFSAAFHFKEWWQVLRSNLGGFAVSLVLVIGVAVLVGLVAETLYFTLILCVVVPFLLAFVGGYTIIVGQTLFALAYREGKEKLTIPAAS